MLVGGSSSSTTDHMTGNSSSQGIMPNQNIFPCSTCDLTFEDSRAQRTHMREPWHVYNLKRRISDLPPISANDYAENIATSLVSSKQGPSNTASSLAVDRLSSDDESAEDSDDFDDVVDRGAQTNCCLFCTKVSDSLETSVEHMFSDHGLYIPEIEHLSSLEAMVGYLRTVIDKYNECIYCGISKRSGPGIRRHMLDKNHCMINLKREPELLEFWELSDSEGFNTDTEETPNTQSQDADPAVSKDISYGEYTLPSGRIVGTKSKAREARLSARRSALKIKDTRDRMTVENAVDKPVTTPSANPGESLVISQGRTPDRTVAVRDAAGLLGVSDQQMRSLVTLQRKTQKQEEIVRASAPWADEKGGTHQKHYKTKMWLRDG